MTLSELGLLLISILTSATGQFLLKVGALQIGKVTASNWLALIAEILQTPHLVTGLCCYGLGAFAYILLLTRVDLSVAAPAASLIYVFSVFMGYFFFQESIPLSRVVGLVLIVSGVILVVWRK